MMWVSLKSKDMCLYKRKAGGDLSQTGEEKTDTQKRQSRDDGGRDWRDVSTSQVMPRMPQPSEVRRETWSTFSPRTSAGRVASKTVRE